MFKQKLKNVLSEQHDAMTEMKMEGVAAALLVQNRNMEAELGLRRNIHSLHANQREKEQRTHNSFRELQLVRAASVPPPEAHFLVVKPFSSSGSLQKHQLELMDLASSFDRRIKGESTKPRLPNSGNVSCCLHRNGGEVSQKPAVGAGGGREAATG